ncbi:latrophilin-3, partial [Biomphalaria glabrata]
TSTSTAALHRNLSVSIALGQLVYMIGIDRYETPSICKIFAVLLHYFFLTNYSWVMNEAFNLYIVITYSTHNPSDLTDSGSMIRYYVLGW